MRLLWIAGAMLFSYLLGSTPTAYLYVKVLRGIDIREYGSHNPGATNVMRVVGKRHGLVVLGTDVVKGLMAVLLLRPMAVAGLPASCADTWAPILVGLAVICGHNWPVWLRFRGGRGVATSAGVLLALQWPSVVVGLAVFGLVFAATRTVSLGSLAGAVVVPVAIWFFKGGLVLTVFGAAAALLIVLRHIPNIKRLLRHEELSFERDEE